LWSAVTSHTVAAAPRPFEPSLPGRPRVMPGLAQPGPAMAGPPPLRALSSLRARRRSGRDAVVGRAAVLIRAGRQRLRGPPCTWNSTKSGTRLRFPIGLEAEGPFRLAGIDGAKARYRRCQAGLLHLDRCGSDATSDASACWSGGRRSPRVRGVKLGEDGKVTMSFGAASHAFDGRKAARRAATSGAVSALAFESPLARIWVETVVPLG
jgi:hypothetical protein